MRFNSAYFTVKLRICPHRNRSGKELCRTAVPDMPDKPSSVDTITWNDTFNVIAQVCGGETQLTASFIAMLNRAADAVKMTKHTRRTRNVACFKEFSHPR